MRILTFFFVLISFLEQCQAQFFVKPIYYINYNLYSWYQKPYQRYPPQQFNFPDTRSVGQVLNVLPGVGGGLLIGDKRYFAFSLEGQANYYPFSFDLVEYKGMGAVSFPVLGLFHIFLNSSFREEPDPDFKKPPTSRTFIYFGGGVQWMATEFQARPQDYQKQYNPFFMTYVGEVGLGMGLNGSIFAIFGRFGMDDQEGISIDVGIKIGSDGLSK